MEGKKIGEEKMEGRVDFFVCCLDEEKIMEKKIERIFFFVWILCRVA